MKVGDLVRLKSGGPMMTVIADCGLYGLRCAYISSVLDEYHEHLFPVAALVYDENIPLYT